jgi:heme exporter protein A
MTGTGQLTIANVTCKRGGRVLFEALNQTLNPGQAALVTGPNGSGKSSLLRLVAGLIIPVCGQVVCQGKIALADENHALDPETTLEKALSFWAAIDGMLPERCEAAISKMGVYYLGGIPVRLFSTGQRKRAAIARVIASGADIWLLDEPANGLDTAGVALLESAIAAHRAQGGIVLVTSHQPLDVPDAMSIRLGAA